MDINNEYGVLEMQEELLSLLKTFHAFCVSNDVKYSLDWGTLLGAVRHKGFIPWDDDLDVMLDRNNYDKLRRIVNQQDDFVLDENYPLAYWIPRIRFSKVDKKFVYPPMIDILIMDNAPDGRLARKCRVLAAKALQGMLKEKPRYDKGSAIMRFVTWITYRIGSLFSVKTKKHWFDSLSQLSERNKTREITSYNEEYSCLGKYYPSGMMDEIITIPFEDIEAYAVKDYHKCLTVQFGENYMTPIKIRETHAEMFKARLAEPNNK